MKGGLCCQPGSSTWDPGRKDPTLELLVSYLMAWSKHLRPWKCAHLRSTEEEMSVLAPSSEGCFSIIVLPTPTVPSDRLGWTQRLSFHSLVMENKNLTCTMNKSPEDCRGKKGKSIGRKEICPDPNLQRYQEYSKKTRLNNPVFAIGSYEQIPKPSDTKASTFIELILVPPFRERYLWQN